jgi:hypothetical protein
VDVTNNFPASDETRVHEHPTKNSGGGQVSLKRSSPTTTKVPPLHLLEIHILKHVKEGYVSSQNGARLFNLLPFREYKYLDHFFFS